MLPSTAVTQDEQLASLALGAATQLDRLQRNLDADIDAIRRFADAIATFSGLDERPTPDAFALDPMSSEMFNAAVSEVSDHPITDVGSLNQANRGAISQFKGSRKPGLGTTA